MLNNEEIIMTADPSSDRAGPTATFVTPRRAGLYRRPSKSAHDSRISAVKSLLPLLFSKDRSTGEHSAKTARWAEAVARRCGLAEQETRLIKIGALLHDIGKLEVPEFVLRKTSSLTDAEADVMRRHVDDGARALSGIPRMDEVRAMVRHHHERWDGSGYPARLCGDEIPLGARIIAVADAFDAMTSDRPYRRRLSLSVARARLSAGAGKQFDSFVVGKFVECLATRNDVQRSRSDVSIQPD